MQKHIIVHTLTLSAFRVPAGFDFLTCLVHGKAYPIGVTKIDGCLPYCKYRKCLSFCKAFLLTRFWRHSHHSLEVCGCSEAVGEARLYDGFC